MESGSNNQNESNLMDVDDEDNGATSNVTTPPQQNNTTVHVESMRMEVETYENCSNPNPNTRRSRITEETKIVIERQKVNRCLNFTEKRSRKDDEDNEGDGGKKQKLE